MTRNNKCWCGCREKEALVIVVSCMLSHSVMSNSVVPWTITLQAPLSMEFLGKNTGASCHFLPQGMFRTQSPFPTPGDIPDPDFEPMSLVSLALVMGSLPLAPSGKPRELFVGM